MSKIFHYRKDETVEVYHQKSISHTEDGAKNIEIQRKWGKVFLVSVKKVVAISISSSSIKSFTSLIIIFEKKK